MISKEDVPFPVLQDHGEQGRDLSPPGSKPDSAARGRSSMPAGCLETPSRTYTVVGYPIDFAVSAPPAPLDPLAPRDPSRLCETLRALRRVPIADSPPGSVRKRKKRTSSDASNPPRPKREAPKISLIAAPTFTCLMVGNEVAMSAVSHVRPSPKDNPPKDSPPASAYEEILSKFVPAEYHDFADVFSEQEACQLPPHRPFDHPIDLESDSKVPFGLIYNMSETEQEAL